MAEERVDSADFVEAHFVDKLLEDQGFGGEEVDAPLPVVEADRSGDDLFDLTGIAAADEAVVFRLRSLWVP